MNDKNKVGRPKLADKALKKETYTMLVMCFIMVLMLTSIGIKSIPIDSLNGSIGANGKCSVKSYKTSLSTIKIVMNCDKNIKSAKLYDVSLKHGTNGLYGYKYVSMDTNKIVKYSWVSKYGNVHNKTYTIYNK